MGDPAKAENPVARFADIRQVLKFAGNQPKAATTEQPSANSAKRTQPGDVANLERSSRRGSLDIQKLEWKSIAEEVREFTERAQLTLAADPAPCGSGEKYKRCWGKDVPPVPGDWLKMLKDAAWRVDTAMQVKSGHPKCARNLFAFPSPVRANIRLTCRRKTLAQGVTCEIRWT